MINKSMQHAREVASDPLKHISLAAGDAVAWFVLGGMMGIMIDAWWNSPLSCWFA